MGRFTSHGRIEQKEILLALQRSFKERTSQYIHLINPAALADNVLKRLTWMLPAIGPKETR